ncbi:MAG: DUF4013 domain-containing protein [Methanoregulaceae archaeon]|nr:MAG: DUF4013 domain-containing protein [Methanoregulaceae archaeon]
MDFGNMLGDAFTYTKEGVLGNMNRWLKLILAIICLGLPFNGYIMRVYRGATPAPDVDRWGTLFVDGLKLLAVGIVYAIPIMILWVFIYGQFFLGIFSGSLDENAMAAFEPNFLLMMMFYIVEIAITVLMPIASIRFARTGTFAEAFNFSAIFETIGRIGWLNYIIALVLVSVVVSIPIVILIVGFILVGGASLFMLKESGVFLFLGLLVLMILLILALAPLFGVFQARYMTRLYDSAAPAGAAS